MNLVDENEEEKNRENDSFEHFDMKQIYINTWPLFCFEFGLKQNITDDAHLWQKVKTLKQSIEFAKENK